MFVAEKAKLESKWRKSSDSSKKRREDAARPMREASSYDLPPYSLIVLRGKLPDGLPRCAEFDADETRISFAKNSRKPPFSLGLQSFLELLLHKIGVPRVSHTVHETDALSQKQLDKTIVHGMHAVGMSDLN